MKMTKSIGETIIERFLITIGVMLFTRIGTFIPVPGINHTYLAFYMQNHSIAKNLINTFSSNETFIIGLFALNIFPYINASILIQVILGISPKLSKLQKEGDLEGRRFINLLTRLLTFILSIIQSIGLIIYLKQVLFNWNFILAFEIIVWLTAGSMIVLWLSELVTDYGLGNGPSVLVYTNIISNLPNLVKPIIIQNSENLTILTKITFVGILFISLYGMIFLQEGIRKIPLISSKQLTELSEKNFDNSKSYIPLRFNSAGVMPIILATSILVVPNYINNLGLFPQLKYVINFKFLKFAYWMLYFMLILIFNSFYSLFILNPKDMSDQLQKMAFAVPGIRPGNQTAFYLKQTIKRVNLIGGVMLAILATLPNFLAALFNISNLNGLSTTSLLILVGVILELGRDIKNIYYSGIYTNLY